VPTVRRLGLWSGVGVNVGVMIGTGVFVSAGFMADRMPPATILLAWVVGGVVAMAGARAYAAVSALIPRSGGEYRYLSDLFHPWLGTLAGWTSLLAGFAAPVASSAATAGPFAETLLPGLDSGVVGAAIIAGVTLAHAFHHGLSRVVQDTLAVAKVVLVAGFIAAGLVLGESGWPDWSPRAPDGAVATFMAQLVFVMYAYTGWNSAVYAAEEFDDPRRTVPRSMVIATAAVMLIYLLVNWVLVANLDGAMVAAFVGGDSARITFAHLVTDRLLGDLGGKVMSILVVVVLVSSVSAMTLVGPRVYQEMARDGHLPRVFIGRAGRPPVLSVLLQGAIALAVYATHTLAELIGNITVLLTLSSALTAAGLFRVQLSPRHAEKPGALPLVAAAVYVAMSAWMLAVVFLASARALIWPAILVVASTAAYLARRRRV
jgi:APA family basic amino acid/polyamine antiporter